MGLAITPIWVIDPNYNPGEAAVDQGLIIFGEMGKDNAGACRAIRLSDGTDVWRCQTPGAVMSDVHTEGGLAFFIVTFMVGPQNAMQSYMYAVDVATGLTRWRTLIEGWGGPEFLVKTEGIVLTTNKYLIPAPITDEDIHYLVLLIDKQTGAIKKSLDLGAGAIIMAIWNNQIAIIHKDRPWIDILDANAWTTSRIYTDHAGIRAACFLDDRCYISTWRSVVAAINLATGKQEWSQSYSDDVVWVHAQGKNVFAAMQASDGTNGSISLLDNVNGIAIWTVSAGTSAPLLGPVVGDKLLAQIRIRPAASKTAITIGLDIATGAEVFRCEFPYSLGWISDAGQNIALSSHLDKLFALNLNWFWRIAYGGNIRGTPAQTNDGIVFGNADGRLISIAVVDGRVRWTANLPSP